MIQQKVSANSLSVMFNEDYSKEVLPEPFRLRPNVSFLITYSEYIKYLLSLQETNEVTLSGNVEYLMSLAKTNSELLYKFYLQDIAFAIAKEVWYAEIFHGDGSIILPFSYDGNIANASSYINYYPQCKQFEGVLNTKLREANFKGFKIRNQHNLELFKLATVLQSTSEQVPLVREISLVYDL